jgi:hypothetical protein
MNDHKTKEQESDSTTDYILITFIVFFTIFGFILCAYLVFIESKKRKSIKEETCNNVVYRMSAMLNNDVYGQNPIEESEYSVPYYEVTRRV